MSETQWDSRIGRRLKLRDLHILSCVVQWGSMAKAASHLAMSQPAVSQAIADLENALRVRLLDRSRRGVSPTPYAEVLLKRGRAAFDELRQGIRDIEFLADPTTGEVRVAAGDTAAAGLLPALIGRLSRAHPGIAIRVTQVNAETMDFRELRERTVDLTLARIPKSFSNDDLGAEILFEDPHRVVVGERSPWARRRKVTLADLAAERWIFPSNPAIRDLITEAFNADRLEVPREQVRASSILLRNHLLATGRFVTILPESVLRYNAGRWPVKALPIELGVRPRCLAMVTLKGRTVSSIARLFMEQAREVAKTM